MLYIFGIYDTVYYDYLGGDTARENPLDSYSELTELTYDNEDDMSYRGDKDMYQGSIVNVGGEHGNVLSYDRMLTTKKDPDTGDYLYAGRIPHEAVYQNY
ncbi:MAG: hypothetical protein IJ499_06740 [Clostridia bacterium]|nr:hypothetical protein [Clostridia bacterium]